MPDLRDRRGSAPARAEGRSPATSLPVELPAASAAMLIAGAYGAVLSAVAALLSHGVLVAGDDGKPVLSDGAAASEDVEHAVVELVRTSPGLTIHAMYRRLRNDPVIVRLGDGS